MPSPMPCCARRIGRESADHAPVRVDAERTATARGLVARERRRPAPVRPELEATSSPYRVLEGTFIDAVLTNRLDGGSAAPVSCLVTNPVYALSGRDVLIPAGARVLGETRPVQALGETRLAVLFHRLILPDGRSVRLDQFKGLNQIGDAGLRDKVNHHYWSTLGAAAAVGLVSGLSQLIGTAGFGSGDGDARWSWRAVPPMRAPRRPRRSWRGS